MKTTATGNHPESFHFHQFGSESGISPLLERTLVMDRLIDLLVQKAKAQFHWPEIYVKAQAVLASLALSTNAYDLARSRLTNALRYAQRQEFGAATFELRQLRGQLA